MLRTLALSNFKAFGDRQVLPLAPITLIFGANSAGKSSIVQALLLLKQTLSESHSAGQPLRLRGDLIDAGSFYDVIFKHELYRICEITPLLGTEVFGTQNLLGPYTASPVHHAGLGFQFVASRERNNPRPCIREVNCYWGSSDRWWKSEKWLFQLRPLDDRHLESVFEAHRDTPQLLRTTELNEDHPLWENLYEQFRENMSHSLLDTFSRLLRRLKDRDNHRRQIDVILSTSRDDVIDDQAAAENRLNEFINLLSHQRERLQAYDLPQYLEDARSVNGHHLLSMQNFLPHNIRMNQPPLWRHLEHFLSASTRMSQQDIDAVREICMPNLAVCALECSQAIRQILATMEYIGPLRQYPRRDTTYSGNPIRYVGKSGELVSEVLIGDRRLLERTNEVLQRFGADYRVELHSSEDPLMADLHRLSLVDRRTNTEVSIRDVGVGISQILPVVVQCMLSKRTLVLIEQPEVHLHPALQAELATVLAYSIQERRNQLLVETHSEHLVLRLRRLIREGHLSASDVCCLYIDREAGGSRVRELPLDEEGDFIERLPRGFFGDRYQELFLP